MIAKAKTESLQTHLLQSHRLSHLPAKLTDRKLWLQVHARIHGERTGPLDENHGA